MTSAQFIARLIGPVLVVGALAMLLDADDYRAMIVEFLGSSALIYLAGAIALAVGLAIVNIHNSWRWGWPLVITVFGWLAVIGGVLRMIAPRFVETVATAIYLRSGAVIALGIVLLAVGAFLSFKGYSV